MTTSSLVGPNSGQITMAELSQVALGCFLETWGSVGRLDIDKTAEVILRIFDAADSQQISFLKTFSIIRKAVQVYLQSSGSQRERNIQLIGYGKRHSSFLSSNRKAQHSPIFGLCDWYQLASTLKSTAARVQFLREVVFRARRENTHISPTDMVILADIQEPVTSILNGVWHSISEATVLTAMPCFPNIPTLNPPQGSVTATVDGSNDRQHEWRKQRIL
jgi:hypothetical protein